MGANTTTDLWLIRTADNWIAGPYTKDQVRTMVLEAKLTLEDEVCPSNGYWFYLSEPEHVRQFLGVEVPKVRVRAQLDDEITEPSVEGATSLEDEQNEVDSIEQTSRDSTFFQSSSENRGSVTSLIDKRNSEEIDEEERSLWLDLIWIMLVGGVLLGLILYYVSAH